MSWIQDWLLLIGGVSFILALQGLSSAKSAERGFRWGIAGMVLTVSMTLLAPTVQSMGWIVLALILGGGLGVHIANKTPMTALPQLVAAFHSLVGLAAVCVAVAVFDTPESCGIWRLQSSHLLEMGLGAAVGAITVTGSVVGFLKLQGWVSSQPWSLPYKHQINLALGVLILLFLIIFSWTASAFALTLLIMLSLALGALLVMPIGGADMPVVISMLNSYSGWAAAGIGFTLSHPPLLVTGALVGSSGAILSYVMCRGMNRSLWNVIAGGFGNSESSGEEGSTKEQKTAKQGSPEDAAFMMKNAQSVIIIPGYGMAVARAQHSLQEMTALLKKNGVQVRYAIHPVAGRMPGHMNVLLAEASIPYEDVLELDEINSDFGQTDVVYIIGANDVTNPAAKTDPKSPIYGMPILDAHKARSVFFVKRSMGVGYAGIDNDLFYEDRTMMLLGDAKKVTESIVKALAED